MVTWICQVESAALPETVESVEVVKVEEKSPEEQPGIEADVEVEERKAEAEESDEVRVKTGRKG